ncbi:MAG: deoxyribodipyrimidine photo-lyase [Propionibacteriaceae bacterium]|nr:deoxyribodipyrimidine photo-lyase [Propionibacteriaceae bacterium]
MSKQSICIFIFHRDLRIYDNTALIYASKNYDYVLPIFIFDPIQLDKNKLKSDKCVKFMCDCIKELSETIKKLGAKLYLFYGDTLTIVKKLYKTLYDKQNKSIEKINNISLQWNEDYTLFAQQRDNSIREFLKKQQIKKTIEKKII